MSLIKITTESKDYTKAGNIDWSDKAVGYEFYNSGSTLLYINEMPLQPGSVLDTMYSGFQDVTKYRLRFDTTVTPPINPRLTVVTYKIAE